jgi:hypothetical protein
MSAHDEFGRRAQILPDVKVPDDFVAPNAIAAQGITDDLARLLYEAANAVELSDDTLACSTWDDILTQGPEVVYEETMRQAFAVRALLAQAAPPDGWFQFGSHAGEEFGWLDLEFSTEVSDDGLPRWERPVPPKRLLEFLREIESSSDTPMHTAADISQFRAEVLGDWSEA